MSPWDCCFFVTLSSSLPVILSSSLPVILSSSKDEPVASCHPELAVSLSSWARCFFVILSSLLLCHPELVASLSSWARCFFVILSSSKDESHRSHWAFDTVPLRQAQSDIQSVILSSSKGEPVASCHPELVEGWVHHFFVTLSSSKDEPVEG